MRIFGGVVAASIVALSFGAVLYLWPLVHGADPDWLAYALLYRLGRLLLGLIPAFVALIVFLIMMKSKSRIWAASLTAVVLLGIAAYLGWFEYARLVPFTARATSGASLAATWTS